MKGDEGIDHLKKICFTRTERCLIPQTQTKYRTNSKARCLNASCHSGQSYPLCRKRKGGVQGEEGIHTWKCCESFGFSRCEIFSLQNTKTESCAFETFESSLRVQTCSATRMILSSIANFVLILFKKPRLFLFSSDYAWWLFNSEIKFKTCSQVLVTS